MRWQTGFRRIRLVGVAALVLGALLLLSVVLTNTLGLAPDPAFTQLYAALWPLGLMLLVLGALLWVAVWVLMGFVPPADRPEARLAEPTRARFDH